MSESEDIEFESEDISSEETGRDTTETDESTDDDSDHEEEDISRPWHDFLEEAWGDVEDKAENFIEESNEDDIFQAREATYSAVRSDMRRALQSRFVDFFQLAHEFKRDPVYKKIIETAQQARADDDMDYEEALVHATQKRALLFNRLIDQWEPVWTDEEEEDSQ